MLQAVGTSGNACESKKTGQIEKLGLRVEVMRIAGREQEVVLIPKGPADEFNIEEVDIRGVAQKEVVDDGTVIVREGQLEKKFNALSALNKRALGSASVNAAALAEAGRDSDSEVEGNAQAVWLKFILISRVSVSWGGGMLGFVLAEVGRAVLGKNDSRRVVESVCLDFLVDDPHTSLAPMNKLGLRPSVPCVCMCACAGDRERVRRRLQRRLRRVALRDLFVDPRIGTIGGVNLLCVCKQKRCNTPAPATAAPRHPARETAAATTPGNHNKW